MTFKTFLDKSLVIDQGKQKETKTCLHVGSCEKPTALLQ